MTLKRATWPQGELLVVEHDQDVIESADQLLDFGPAVALRVEPLDFVHRLAPSGGHPSRKHGQAGCAGVHSTAARSRARGSRALASFTLRVNDERA